ncbi:DUF6290 family protein [Sphingobacterium composti Ten et al. 2007 non Yoo et al. 2007]|uniref:DUF6290 family protein n=1 Tax=Sphingobacterium composti TaxID=363260 RepID=UPI00135AAAEA|nr:DUF6290 family protein [Sphingobacterium composti Ten et al. 2007 non Yoo et al. 2007]
MERKIEKKSSAKIEIRLTDDEKEIIKAYAKNDGLTVTDYIKYLALNQKFIAKRIEYQADLRNFNFEIHKIGANINQLARHVNRAEKFKTIDSGTINVFHLFMKDYIQLMNDANELIRKMYSKLAKI